MNVQPQKINEWLARVAWGSITVVAGYAATQIGSLTASISALNTNVAVLIEQRKSEKEKTDSLRADAIHDRKILTDHEKRITILEVKEAKK